MARAAWAHPALAGQRNLEGVDGGHGQLRPVGIDDIDVEALRRRLESTVRGDVLFDAGHRAIYSHDSSNYRQPPLGVVCPRDTEDLVAAVAAAREQGAPVLPRGGGTGLSGATCNVAVVIDTSKYMREVVEVDADASTARVQAGCIRDHLSHPCEAEHGLTFAPDTATHAYATLGGMIGSNACGVHSLTAGRTSDNVEELHVLLYDGTRLTVGVSEEQLLDETVAAGGGRGRSTRGCASCAIATPTAPASSTPTSRAESRATTSTSSCPSGASTSPVRSPAPRAPARPCSRPDCAWSRAHRAAACSCSATKASSRPPTRPPGCWSTDRPASRRWTAR